MVDGIDIDGALGAGPGEEPYPIVMGRAAAAEIAALGPDAVDRQGRSDLHRDGRGVRTVPHRLRRPAAHLGPGNHDHPGVPAQPAGPNRHPARRHPGRLRYVAPRPHRRLSWTRTRSSGWTPWPAAPTGRSWCSATTRHGASGCSWCSATSTAPASTSPASTGSSPSSCAGRPSSPTSPATPTATSSATFPPPVLPLDRGRLWEGLPRQLGRVPGLRGRDPPDPPAHLQRPGCHRVERAVSVAVRRPLPQVRDRAAG